jgi:hypothetical protein
VQDREADARPLGFPREALGLLPGRRMTAFSDGIEVRKRAAVIEAHGRLDYDFKDHGREVRLVGSRELDRVPRRGMRRADVVGRDVEEKVL